LHGTWGLLPIFLNALSSCLIVEVQVDGQSWRQEFSRGVPTASLMPVGPARGTGTSLTFWPDADIFKDDRSFSFTTLRERFREVACLCPGLSLRLRDQHLDPALEFHSEPGQDLRDLLELHSRGRLLVHPTIIHGKASVPEGEIEVAFRWVHSTTQRVIGLVNHTRTDEGPHCAGLCRGLGRVWRLLWGSFVGPDGTRIEATQAGGAGLLAVVAVHLQEPQWRGSTRQILNNPEIEAPVAGLAGDCLGDFYDAHADEAEAIAEHLADPRPADPKSGWL
jgi:DNA gyrase subunit B